MINPVFRREMRTVLRTWKTFTVITLYVICMAAVAGIFLMMMLNNSYYNGFNPQSATNLYTALSGFQLGLILLIVPALTGGAISGERERQTLDLMLVTKMSSFTIIIGKLLSSIMVVILMITASMPVYAVILFYGGISVLDLAAMLLFTICVAFLAGSIALFLSTLFKKTVQTMIVTYVVILLLSLGTIVAVAVMTSMRSQRGVYPDIILQNISYTILAFNPFVGYASILDSQLGIGVMSGLMYSISYYYRQVNALHSYIWMTNVIINMVTVIALNIMSALMLNPVRRSKKYK